MNDPPFIRLYKLGKAYQGKEPLYQNINFFFEKGDFRYLTGASGAGKTTLFRLLLGLEKPTWGEVHFRGRIVAKLPPPKRPLHRRSFGIIFQDNKLLLKQTVLQNIRLPLIIQGVPLRKADHQVAQLAEKLNLTSLLEQPVSTLSGGEQQLTALARAAIHSPAVILADEPTANLDLEMSARVLDLLELFHQEGATVIFATHNLELLKERPHPTLLIKDRNFFEVKTP